MNDYNERAVSLFAEFSRSDAAGQYEPWVVEMVGRINWRVPPTMGRMRNHAAGFAKAERVGSSRETQAPESL
jgi:hypothetical protein